MRGEMNRLRGIAQRIADVETFETGEDEFRPDRRIRPEPRECSGNEGPSAGGSS